MAPNVAGMYSCFKCGHDLSEHDVYDGCRHIHRDWVEDRKCICSNFQPMARCDCERCVRKD
jgi:hypothetical protein